jgi:hypothetical protein
MRKRKNLSVAEIKEQANKIMRESENDFSDGRRHIAMFVEDLLLRAGQYKGFGYLSKDSVAPGKSCGISFVDNEPKFHDHTRVEYF